jgi:AmiR/NasT family two-component response regulator
MAALRVFVVWTHPLFHESVRLLLRHPEVDLVGATSDHNASYSQIVALKPDVVIIEKTEAEEQAETETISILRRGPRVVRLSLADNELSIYQRQHRTVAKAEDLVRVILEDGSEDPA